MSPPAFPYPRIKPALEKEQPVDGPGDDRVCDVFLRGPKSLLRVVQAKPGIQRVGYVEIDVRRQLPRAAGVEPDDRIDHLDRGIVVLKRPGIEQAAAEMDDADAIALHDRRQRSLPHRHPASVQRQLERREDFPNPSVLLLDGQPRHSGSSPKNRCPGVLRAAAGVEPSITLAAGTCPIPGRCAPPPWPTREP